MPATLRRKQRQELTLRKSFLEAMRSKLSSSLSRRPSDKSSPRPSETRRRDYRDAQYDTPAPLHRSPIAFYTSPHSIRNLPPEILAYIFVLGSEDDFILPVAVSHVCRFWRDLSLNTPLLWRKISLGSHYGMWRERIYRARACTLDIQLKSGNRHARNMGFYDVQRYMHLVMPYIRYWRSLNITFLEYQPYLWNAALSECCTRSNRTQAPELEELCLVYRHNDDTKEFCLFSGKAPRLRRVTIAGLRLTWLPSLFQNLTHLDYTHHGSTCGYQAVQELFYMLHVSSQLVELRILFPQHGQGHRTRTSQRISPVSGVVHLPWLRMLHLRVESRDIPAELIQLASMVDTPVLRELVLADTACQRSAFHSVDTFWTLYAVPPSLRTVHLQHGWYTKAGVVYLTKFRNLQWLTLRRGDTQSTDWFSLHGRRRRSSVLPR